MRQTSDISNEVLNKTDFADQFDKLANEVESALKFFVLIVHDIHGKIFDYEVDGFEDQLFIGDANIPYLLALPYLGCKSSNDEINQNSRDFILSEDNPHYFGETASNGIGGS